MLQEHYINSFCVTFVVIKQRVRSMLTLQLLIFGCMHAVCARDYNKHVKVKKLLEHAIDTVRVFLCFATGTRLVFREWHLGIVPRAPRPKKSPAPPR